MVGFLACIIFSDWVDWVNEICLSFTDNVKPLMSLHRLVQLPVTFGISVVCIDRALSLSLSFSGHIGLLSSTGQWADSSMFQQFLWNQLLYKLIQSNFGSF